jgi:CheY-like chemotaxis protein
MPLPLYAHPSLTVLIDDSDRFLSSVAFQLAPHLVSTSFHDTDEALSWLCAQAPSEGVALQPNFDTYPGTATPWQVSVDLTQIQRISLQTQRFMTPSVVVVDYSMPQMNGVEVCEALRHLPFKKILFTGAADEKIAVNAFNRGLIDRYIRKSDDNALDRLEADIAALQQEYFIARSAPLRALLEVHDYAFLADPAFCAIVHDLMAREHIVEYYLQCDPPGLVMYDERGRAHRLVVETDASLDAHIEVARDNEGPPSLLEALASRVVVPWFTDGDGMYTRACAQAWHRYMAPAGICRGARTFYWALFACPSKAELDATLPYAEFMRNRHWAG